jgi:hypothetical protein
VNVWRFIPLITEEKKAMSSNLQYGRHFSLLSISDIVVDSNADWNLCQSGEAEIIYPRTIRVLGTRVSVTIKTLSAIRQKEIMLADAEVFASLNHVSITLIITLF